jgi:ABC-type nitrate/sulfonate/bicarbonate transport system permease component
VAAADGLVVRLLKRTMPFQVVPEDMLRSIASVARHASYRAGEIVYRAGDKADDIYVMVSGAIEHLLSETETTVERNRVMRSGDVFGWAAVLSPEKRVRLATTTCTETAEVIRINGPALIARLSTDPATSAVVMSRFATMITREFGAPAAAADLVSSTGSAEAAQPKPVQAWRQPTGLALTMFRMARWLRSPKPYLMLLGFGLFLAFWYLAVEVWKLPRFREMPGLTVVIREWFSKDPTYGLSIYTPEYYEHIWVSIRRVGIAFFLATALGVPLGLFLGWSRTFREYVFPVFETLRPIPILAWVPLAILMFTGSETPVIFLTFLASFFATALNTMLGVQSIDESYTRAANCLGASKLQVFWHIIVPGAMPFIFTGLQISVGVAWFSLVAAEMVSGQFGLGYVINTSYTMVRYPTIVIGMITLGAVGYVTSALVRVVGDHMMEWRVRELALGGR